MKRESISEELRQQVLQRDHYTCRYCGSKDGPFHADHVYPVSKGGETTFSNLVTACEDCNLKKSSRIGLWPKPIRYFDERKEIEKKTAFGIKRDASAIFICLFFSGAMSALYLVLPSELWAREAMFRLAFFASFGLSVLLAIKWVIDFIRS